MPRHAKLQLIGPVTVFAALLAAEGAAHALAAYPSSRMLWSANLQLFGIVRRGHDVIGTYAGAAYFQIICIGLPLLLAACYGLIFRCRFALALASTSSFGYVGLLLGAEYLRDAALHGGPFGIGRMSGPGGCLAGVLLGASLLSLIVSHMSYLRACRNEWPWRPVASLPRPS
jgi:hypothetical protein